MEMYCDTESRGGILEPPGICEVKFRVADQIQKMHQLDPVLMNLDSELEMTASEDDAVDLKKQIKDRETALMPLYLQIAHEFADLHDRSGRMKSKGVVRDVLEWKSSRAYLYWRVKRRIAEDGLRKELIEDADMDFESASAEIVSLVGDAYEDDKTFVAHLEANAGSIADHVSKLKTEAVATAVKTLLAELSSDEKESILGSL